MCQWTEGRGSRCIRLSQGRQRSKPQIQGNSKTTPQKGEDKRTQIRDKDKGKHRLLQTGHTDQDEAHNYRTGSRCVGEGRRASFSHQTIMVCTKPSWCPMLIWLYIINTRVSNMDQSVGFFSEPMAMTSNPGDQQLISGADTLKWKWKSWHQYLK